MFFTTEPYSPKQSKIIALYNHEWQPMAERLCFLCKMFLTVTLTTPQQATDVRILFSQPSYSLLYTVNGNQGYSYCWSIDLLATLACITQMKQAEEQESQRQSSLALLVLKVEGWVLSCITSWTRLRNRFSTGTPRRILAGWYLDFMLVDTLVLSQCGLFQTSRALT